MTMTRDEQNAAIVKVFEEVVAGYISTPTNVQAVLDRLGELEMRISGASDELRDALDGEWITRGNVECALAALTGSSRG